MIYNSDLIVEYFKKYDVATIQQLKNILGTSVVMTIHRKLQQLNYITSISHRGKYYSLLENANFTEKGIWETNSIIFSRHNTLINTVGYFIDNSYAGYSAMELQQELNLRVKEALLHLINNKKIIRDRINKVFVYFSNDRKKNRQQRLNRNKQLSQYALNLKHINEDALAHELKAAIIIFFSLLDEKQRRLYAGLESLKIGRGGDAIISKLLELDPHTIARGREELLEDNIDDGRTRKKGGGRKSVKKNRLGS